MVGAIVGICYNGVMKIKREIVLLAYCFVVVFIVFFFNIKTTLAGSKDHLLINEIYPDPLTGEIEWIELYNPTDNEIELTDCSIEDGTHNPKKLTNNKIDSHDYLVLSKGADFTFGLNNDGDVVILSCDGSIIDQVSYGNWDDGDEYDNAKAPPKGKSITRDENHIDTDNDSLDFTVSDPTPLANYIKKTYPYDIFINEILPAPENGTDFEYIEIYNNEETAVDLTGWQVDDVANGGSSPYFIPTGTIIEAKGYVILYHTLIKIYLNDDGDEVRLIDPNNEEKSKIVYQKAEKGNSYARFDSVWLWTEKLTPNAENIYVKSVGGETDSVSNQAINIADARQLNNGQYVKVEGFVTAIPSVLSASYFYIEDETGGMQIYKHDKKFPTLKSGDRISIYGKLSETSGEKRIIVYNSFDIVVLESDLPPPPPIEITQNQFGEEFEGVYVKIQGRVIKSSGSTFYVDCQGVTIKVIVRKTANIDKPKLRKNDLVEIAGIVSQYKAEYRLLPIRVGDVKITKSAVLPRAGTGILNLVIYSVILNTFIFQIWNLYQKARQKQKNLPKKLLKRPKVVKFASFLAI